MIVIRLCPTSEMKSVLCDKFSHPAWARGNSSPEERFIVFRQIRETSPMKSIPRCLFFTTSNSIGFTFFITGKRVLVIGLGNSGADIIVDVSRQAKKSIVSSRSGGWIVPRLFEVVSLNHFI